MYFRVEDCLPLFDQKVISFFLTDYTENVIMQCSYRLYFSEQIEKPYLREKENRTGKDQYSYSSLMLYLRK